jgi:hypothetical protein
VGKSVRCSSPVNGGEYTVVWPRLSAAFQFRDHPACGGGEGTRPSRDTGDVPRTRAAATPAQALVLIPVIVLGGAAFLVLEDLPRYVWLGSVGGVAVGLLVGFLTRSRAPAERVPRPAAGIGGGAGLLVVGLSTVFGVDEVARLAVVLALLGLFLGFVWTRAFRLALAARGSSGGRRGANPE